ncbi:hypothetical protein ACHAPE_008226 [Trichoderma viride]
MREALSRTKLGRPLIRGLDCVTGHKGQARPGCGSPRCLIYRPAYGPLGDSVPEDAALTCAGDELAMMPRNVASRQSLCWIATSSWDTRMLAEAVQFVHSMDDRISP